MIFFKNICFVCTGNICRSPYAEGALQCYFQEQGLATQVRSYGIAALEGSPPSAHTLELLQAKGLDFSQHRARQVDAEVMYEHDLILVMEEEHQRYLHQQYPFARGKIYLLGKYQNIEITDPYKKPLESYLHMAKQIERCLQDWKERFFVHNQIKSKSV